MITQTPQAQTRRHQERLRRALRAIPRDALMSLHEAGKEQPGLADRVMERVEEKMVQEPSREPDSGGIVLEVLQDERGQ